jgi:5''-nucleotidase.
MVKPTLADKLVVAISSRALFDLTDSHRVYTEAGVDAYHRYQIEHEEEILAPGPAFVLVKKLLRLNRPEKQYVEVILLSRNSADTGLRVFNAIKHYGLDISRAAFTKGEPTSRYVPAFGAHLFLSADTEDVKRVLDDGYAAATIVPSTVGKNETDDLRIAFDGDAVLFSDEAERVYQKSGLAAFSQSESDAALRPLSGGPFKEFLAGLHRIQSDFAADLSPIRTALVTARSAPAHERVIRTLRAWNIRIDEALFLGGLDKGEFLRAFGADIFFDDQHTHIESAAKHVATGHVPHGILNER